MIDQYRILATRRLTRHRRLLLYAATTVLALFASAIFNSYPIRAQTDVKIRLEGTGSMKSPLMLARFRGVGPVGSSPSKCRAIARNDFELSGVFKVGDVEPLEGKPAPDPNLAGTVRVEGTVEPGEAAAFLKFHGQAIDVGP
ncbi:MAG TPA: hypothetical protein VK527_11255, partial [Candidatus Limnocylindrales bacterium]|nr:hypothetical protein [Candidatus Limnocylindrales bacterium]